jgi:hypothetical protein
LIDSSGAVSAVDLTRVTIVLLYVFAGVASHRLLLPRLIRPFKRLAVLLLAAQTLVIALALTIYTSSRFDRWAWSLDFEWNIASTLSSLLLALAGGALLAAAWRRRKKKDLYPIYLLLMGMAFLYLGLDEFQAWKSFVPDWRLRYIALGITIVLMTAIAAWYAPRHTRILLFWLLTGLAISGAGAIVLDLIPWRCGNIGAIQLDGCLRTSHIEETLEFIGFWLMLMAALGLLSESGPISPRVSRFVSFGLPLVWLLSLIILASFPRLELRIMSEAADVRFEKGISLQGYRFDDLSDRVILQLYISAAQKEYIDQGFSIHFVDQVTGETVASRDKWADFRHIIWILGPDHEQIFRQQMEINLPPEAPTNRALWVVLTTWRRRGDEYQSQHVLSSDHRLLNETQTVLSELALPARSAAQFDPPLAIFDNSFTLGAVALPASARAGETLNLEFTWSADATAGDDYAQFLHFGHVDTGAWWVYDKQPLGPRLPTRLWYSGLTDSEVWAAPLPSDMARGRYTVYTGLYRLRDMERVPATSSDGTPYLDARIPLGVITLD